MLVIDPCLTNCLLMDFGCLKVLGLILKEKSSKKRNSMWGRIWSRDKEGRLWIKKAHINRKAQGPCGSHVPRLDAVEKNTCMAFVRM